jgi:PAS domain S-box-containing protein
MVPATRRIGRDVVVQNMRDGVVVVDTRGRVVDLNPVAEHVLDEDRTSMLDRPAEVVLDDLTAGEETEDLDRLGVADGGSDLLGWTGELSTEDGRLFEAHSSPLDDARGRRLGTVVVLQDVTELRNRQQRLTVLNRVLRHNLRNDMNAIDGYATMLADQFDAAPAEQVREVSAEVVDLADKAREIERVMARRGETDPADAATIADSVVDRVSGRFAAEITLSTPDESVPVPGRGILKPALENVIENAAEHNDADQPRVDVTVRRPPEDQTVEFRVTDNGPGIPPQEREVLLEGTETALKHGSGLGLWLVYWSVESLDGDIVFEDNHPRGSVVSLRVPTVQSSTTGARAGAPGIEGSTTGSNAAGR